MFTTQYNSLSQIYMDRENIECDCYVGLSRFLSFGGQKDLTGTKEEICCFISTHFSPFEAIFTVRQSILQPLQLSEHAMLSPATETSTNFV